MNRFKEEALEMLSQGVEAWNRWRETNSRTIHLNNLFDSEEENQPYDLNGYNLKFVNFSKSYLKRCSFRNANLHQAALVGADLCGVDFFGADLSESRFRQAILDNTTKLRSVNLSRARLLDVDLSGLDFSDSNLSECILSEPKGGFYPPSKAKLEGCNLEKANLTGANLEGVVLVKSRLISTILVKANLVDTNQAEVDLTDANLADADLCRASFTRADLTRANFSNANLSGANLSRCQALGANFTKANLTGACIEDWHINSSTKLDDVVCEYIFQKFPDQERLPSDPNRNFAPGEFTKLFQKALSTVNLIFKNGIDWNALLISLEKLEIEAEGAKLSIQSIENKNDGAFVVRVNVPQEANKAEVEKFLKREYEIALQAIDEKYQFQLQLQSERLDEYRQEVQERRQANTSLLRLVETMAENQGPKYNMQGSTFGSFADVVQAGGKQQTVQHIYAAEQKQSLVEAAAEIEKLLKQLQSNGLSLDDAQKQAARDLGNQAKNNSTFKGRLEGWASYLGNAAANGLISEAVVTVLKSVLQSHGIPLP